MMFLLVAKLDPQEVSAQMLRKSCEFWEFFFGLKFTCKCSDVSVQPKVLICKPHNFNLLNLLTNLFLIQ
jgi:hypothetical protein